VTEQDTQRLRDLEAVLRAVTDYLDALDETASRRSSRRARTLTALRDAAARAKGAAQ
jgi:hypothetical protein